MSMRFGLVLQGICPHPLSSTLRSAAHLRADGRRPGVQEIAHRGREGGWHSRQLLPSDNSPTMLLLRDPGRVLSL